MIAALYVQHNGSYFNRAGIDPWDEKRDARKYAGPHPVVAHPPCKRWINLAYANYARYGGEHNRPGNDGGCFAAALGAVMRFGGVLEHPASSHAWNRYGLLRPCGVGWSYQQNDAYARGGYHVCEVWQSAYGHRARKRTWLLYSGITEPPPLRWVRLPGTHQVGFQDQRGKAANKPTLSSNEASATPDAFRDALVFLASIAGPIEPPEGE